MELSKSKPAPKMWQCPKSTDFDYILNLITFLYSESDSEGEYNGTGVVYDSDEDDEDMPILDDGHSMTSEQRKVLNFYNDGSDQELATIQVNDWNIPITFWKNSCCP